VVVELWDACDGGQAAGVKKEANEGGAGIPAAVRGGRSVVRIEHEVLQTGGWGTFLRSRATI
jgi:hypothetical protein